jgi:putative transposase
VNDETEPQAQPAPRRDDEPALLVALFRYGVLGPLLERDDLGAGEVTALVAAAAGATHYLPGRGLVRVSQRTVYAWFKAYREGGIEALRPRQRKDRGTLRACDPRLLDRAVALRQESPQRHTTTLLDILRLEGPPPRLPHRATLNRHLARRGASRAQLRVTATQPTIHMRFAHFGDLWVGDYHHGPLVLAPDGRPVTAKLGAFIDHTTRYPVADRWYLDETLATLRDALLRALLAFGPPRRIYVDRGAVYRAEQLAYSLERLGIRLVHSRPYYSQGRGVIERWWQLAEVFGSELALRPELPTVHELNLLWEAFRSERYLHARHSELGTTPAEAIVGVVPKRLDPELLRELFLVREDRTVHRKSATVEVAGRRFLCDGALRGHRVNVRYDPGDLSSVLVFEHGQRLQRAFPQPDNARPAPPPPPPASRPPAVDYLALLRDDYDRKLLDKARPLAYATLRLEPGFDRAGFIRLVCDLAGCDPGSAQAELGSFWDTWGPLPESLTRIACEHAVRLHGRGRHPRVALHALRTLVLAHWKSKENP